MSVILRIKNCSGLSIIFWFWHLGILTISAFLASLTFWHYEIQKKTALQSKDAKIKAALVFNGVFFLLRCQDAKNAKDAKMVKMPRCQKRCQNVKRPKNAMPFKNKCQQYQDAKTRETKVTSEISHDAAFRN